MQRSMRMHDQIRVDYTDLMTTSKQTNNRRIWGTKLISCRNGL